jgi:hypothetical protein
MRSHKHDSRYYFKSAYEERGNKTWNSWSSTDRKIIPAGVLGRSWRGAEDLRLRGLGGGGGAAGLLLAGETHSYIATQRVKTYSISSGVQWQYAICDCLHLMMRSCNSPFTTKSCAWASIAFLSSRDRCAGSTNAQKARACSYLTKGMRHY